MTGGKILAKECDKLISPKEAIEMLMHCRKDRLSYVLDILRVAGYEFSEKDVEIARAQKVTMEQVNAANRKAKVKKWEDTDNEAVLLLREAYMNGVKFIDVSRLTGVNRTGLYAFLNGDRVIPLAYRDKLIETLKDILGKKDQPDG